MRLLHLVLLVLTLGLLPLQAQELRAKVELRTEALGSEGQIHYEGLRRQLDILSAHFSYTLALLWEEFLSTITHILL